MQLSALILAALGLSARVFAQDSVSCGSNVYTYEQIEEAAEEACRLFDSGSQIGRSRYPHRYNNFEGFAFDNVRGPYQEFPLLRRGVYTGGSPGADRVIITENCDLAGQITHSGAPSRNGFVDCDNAISVRTQGSSSSSGDSSSSDNSGGSSDNTGSSDSNDSSDSSSNNNNGGSSNSSDEDSASIRLVSGAGAMLAGAGAMMFALFV
ncbi:hypothetical protein ACHAQA_001905 [Verticillium albo-atrum]